MDHGGRSRSSLLWILRRLRHDRQVLDAPLTAWIIAAGVQGAVGYVQYAAGLPAGLVLVHVAGATTLMAITAWLWSSTSRVNVSVDELRDHGVVEGGLDSSSVRPLTNSPILSMSAAKKWPMPPMKSIVACAAPAGSCHSWMTQERQHEVHRDAGDRLELFEQCCHGGTSGNAEQPYGLHPREAHRSGPRAASGGFQANC